MSTLAQQRQAIEHAHSLLHSQGVGGNILPTLREAGITLAFFERHQELTKAYHKLWKENQALAKAMSEVARVFPGSEILNYRELHHGEAQDTEA